MPTLALITSSAWRKFVRSLPDRKSPGTEVADATGERVQAWRTGLALPNLGLEPTGRSFVTLTVKTEDGERLYPFAVDEARGLAEELETLCREVDAQTN